MLKNAWIMVFILLKRLSIALFLFSVSRIVFACCNPSTFQWNNIPVFFSGIRFDLSALLYLNLPFILLHIFPTPYFFGKTYQHVCRILFHTINGFALLLNFIDSAWFSFTHKRMTADIFSLVQTGDDVKNNIVPYILDFWYLVLIWIITVYVGVKLYRKTNVKKHFHNELPSIVVRILSMLLIAGLFIIGARGGFQYKPLSVQAAAAMSSPEGIPLVLNSPFTIIKSLNDEPLPFMLYMDNEKALSLFSVQQQLSTTQEFTEENIVEIILESFGCDYIGYFNNGKGYTPFLDSLLKEGYSFTNAYANGKRSIEGIPAIIASVPALMDEPFITSAYNTTRINSLASVLKSKGYRSTFYHGGNNGTMGFDNFCRLTAYDEYIGRNEYEGDKKDYDGHWGIFDEPFFHFINQKLKSENEPFLATVFTLSSHHPYTIPEQYKGRFPKGTLPIHESIGYADHALKTFFEEAAKQSWYQHTLFVITADHTGPSGKEIYSTRSGIFRIPLLLFHPSKKIKGINNESAQQCDIVPTILATLNYSGKYSAFGNNLTDSSATRFAINYQNNSWQIISGNYALEFDGSKTTALYDLESDPLMKKNIYSDNSNSLLLENLLKSVLQQYRQGLIHNSIIPH